MFEWEDALFVVFESNVGGSKCIQCWWPSLQDGHASRFCEFVFGLWLFGEGDGSKRGGRGECGVDYKGGFTRVRAVIGDSGCVGVI